MLAGRERLANHAGGDAPARRSRPPARRRPRSRAPRAFGGEQVGRAGAVACRSGSRSRPPRRRCRAGASRMSLTKSSGAGSASAASNVQHDGAGEPGGREQAQLGALVGEPEQRLLRPEEAARMRLEGQRRRRPAELLRRAPARPRSRRGGRDARRRNCRWRRRRPRAPRAALSVPCCTAKAGLRRLSVIAHRAVPDAWRVGYD